MINFEAIASEASKEAIKQTLQRLKESDPNPLNVKATEEERLEVKHHMMNQIFVEEMIAAGLRKYHEAVSKDK